MRSTCSCHLQICLPSQEWFTQTKASQRIECSFSGGGGGAGGQNLSHEKTGGADSFLF